ncbi:MULTISPECIES: cupin-like domain-containing protein [Paraburkholderia]|uniref:cupin-like domain-containing protein n=1 Tax=Paraburkholderia TaxID=1822464 RepID=UPI00225BA6A4|nr:MULTISPECIES: cupin-like domain-containing protein [Paraburkholderia]MCX4163806.1 cupin-like domain-containing protein [Paraburkholderia megapolitana]MDN7159301.1 cupin-like domain-containing protein [Paraburkholderia sp. CHISQ3]MDQ6496348.1 cupin-like domain-containing protein [Paraburkholderia megapolitana]
MTRPIDDEWRRWIAENLLLDVPPDALQAALVSHDFAAEDAAREVQAALASPYLLGSTRLRNRLRKREWMLSVYGTLNRLRANGGTVERREKLTHDEFFEQYYFQNRPVIITGTFDTWPARTKWSFDYFRERCGDCEVEVQFGREADANYEVNQPKLKRMMRFRDYVDLIERSGRTNDFYMTANNNSHNREALVDLWSDVEPIRAYLDAESPDKGFFWFGPAGTKTPFHHDLTNNFMAQVIGRKQVKLVPLCDTPHMYNHLHCYSQVDGSAVDFTRFPALQNAQLIECTLEPGDLLFLPIGWWHYVEGLDASVTMTFTNFLERNDFGRTYETYHEL